jgi:hypothetical protein
MWRPLLTRMGGTLLTCLKLLTILERHLADLLGMSNMVIDFVPGCEGLQSMKICTF